MKKIKELILKNKVISFILICIIILIIIIIFPSTEKLNNKEIQMYDRLIEIITEREIYNPQEIRVLNATIEYYYDDREYTEEIDHYIFKLTGTNKVGGTINKCYEVSRFFSGDDWRIESNDHCYGLDDTDIGHEQVNTKTIKKINDALKKYWDELGI